MNDARERLYGLLASLVSGVTPDALKAARGLPALAPFHDADPDTLAAGHHAALSVAFASAYLSPLGLVTGDDHLGDLLTAAPDADAAFLDTRLLSWLPLLVLAVRSTGETPWVAVVELALELVAAHRAELGGPRTAGGPTAQPLDLDAPETSLRTVAAGLCRPAVSGWMPTGPALTRLAASVELPGGLGGRADRLTGLLYGAADAGALPSVCGALGTVLSAWADDLDTFERELEVPTVAWAARVRHTVAVVARIGSAA